MKIAICDDDRQELLALSALLKQYERERQDDLSHTAFLSAAELLSALRVGQYDLILLDILMPGLNGIEAATEIRMYNEAVKIIFLTSTPEYAVESYQVQALNYLLKPATAERLFPIFDRLLAEAKQPEATLCIHTQSRMFRLPYRRIEYLEVMGKTLHFFMTDGSREEIPGRLSSYEPQLLAQPGFVKVHRSFLVNLNWIRDVHKWEAAMESGRCVPVARSAYAQVRHAYMEQAFANAALFSDTLKGEPS